MVLRLLNDPVARELLMSRTPARLAYSWHDGTPRVVPIWFHWDGEEIVVAGPPDAPKVAAIAANPTVALTIDSNEFPYKSLQIRGTARVVEVDGVAPEYAAAAERYFGVEQGRGWSDNVGKLFDQMVAIHIQPEWVNIIDFETRFPTALARRMR
jgi:PPOX class probable F420-dependent enzyme